MDKPGHLRLVPFSPSDYSLGEVLVRDSQDRIADIKFVSAALSLYFQWPEESRALFVSREKESFEIAFDYDREERIPSEFKVLFCDEADLARVQDRSEMLIRFEVFRQCFEFRVETMHVNQDMANDPSWHVIIPVPEQLMVYKQRRLPRVILDHTAREQIGRTEMLYNSGETVRPVELVEMGMRSVRLRGVDRRLGDPSSLKIGDQIFAVRVLRHDSEFSIFYFDLHSATQIGQVFDIYRVIAFPHLRPRHSYSNQEVAKLYKDTNYLGKFTNDSAFEDRIKVLSSVWDEVRGVQHLVSADYVSVKDDGTLAGASSCSLSFHHQGKDMWIFHQLCAETSPDLLTQSGELYTWRAEYLAGRNEDLLAGVWFDSKSRWLERIYVKFAFHKGKNVDLRPVGIIRRTFDKTPVAQGVEVGSLSFGAFERKVVSGTGVFGGVCPSLLNASGLLDSLVYLESYDGNLNEEFTGALINELGLDELRLEMTCPIEVLSKIPRKTGDEDVPCSDRLCTFDKASLVDFISSVEHSVAVTRRKKTRCDHFESS